MTVIVRSAADFLYPFVLTYGVYLVLHGHLTPGGGFQGGAVIATGAALMMVSNDFTAISKAFKRNFFSVCELVGLLLFLWLGLSAVFSGNAFLYNWLAPLGGLFGEAVPYGVNSGSLNAGGLIPILNLAIGLEVLGALSIIIYYMLRYVVRSGKGGQDAR